MGRAIVGQIAAVTPGMEVVAIANRHVERARDACLAAGTGDPVTIHDEEGLLRAVEERRTAVTDDPQLPCASVAVDVVLEVTGTVEFGARVALAAFAHRKHLVTMNAELQGTLGPVLKARAHEAGVLISDSDGDQPGVLMNLVRFVRGIGVRPVLLGNVKGLHDPYRTPETQAAFAQAHGLSAQLATSAADGTKMSFEQAIVANATGFRVSRRGMYGFSCDDVHDAERLFPLEELLDGGRVDYVVGAKPAPGVFVLGVHDDPIQRRWLELYKLGEGPLYTFYTPYHLCHLEVPTTIARVVLFGDTAVEPLDGPAVDVVAVAKRDLGAGDLTDGIGGFSAYGVCENAETAASERLLPMGLAEDCRLVRDVARDQVLTYDDVEVPGGRICDELRNEQARRFALSRRAGVSS
jgi:predicted homoserine dehydrogenase-like protein